MKKKLIYYYIILIHIFIVLILVKSNFFEKVQYKLNLTGLAETTDYYHKMLLYQLRSDGNVPINSTIFIGDSITQALCVSAVSPHSVNYGIAKDTTIGVINRIPIYKSIHKANCIVFAIGINDMKLRPNEEILQNYRTIINLVPSNIPVLFSAVLPIDEKYRPDQKGWNKERILPLNKDLMHLTENFENIFFIDAGPLLLDSTGNLAEDAHVGDGLHLNTKGNKIWIKALKNALSLD